MNENVRKLIAAASEIADRRAERAAWVRKTGRAWLKAMQEMDDLLMGIAGRVSDAEFDRLFDEEQARVDAVGLPLKDAKERDMWPRELHWGGI